MKHTTDELILAAHIRNLANERWIAARNALQTRWEANNPGQSRPITEASSELNAEHKPEHFIQEALRELENVANIVATTQDAKRQ